MNARTVPLLDARTFRDWLVACDNERNCAATTLAETDPRTGALAEDLLELTIRVSVRGPALIEIDSGQTGNATDALEIDGKAVSGFAKDHGRLMVPIPQRTSFLAQLLGGHHLVARQANNAIESRASLSGLTAALTWIDDMQGKVGTTSALVAKGAASASVAGPGYRLVQPRPRTPDLPPIKPSRQAIAALQDDHSCSPKVGPWTVQRLDRNSTLLLVQWPCDVGPYNPYSDAMILDEAGKMTPARFDHGPGLGEGTDNVVVNARWLDKDRLLEANAIGRGMGDCGTVSRFAWTGEMFRMTYRAVMPECRGSMVRLPVWTVEVQDVPANPR